MAIFIEGRPVRFGMTEVDVERERFAVPRGLIAQVGARRSDPRPVMHVRNAGRAAAEGTVAGGTRCVGAAEQIDRWRRTSLRCRHRT